MNVLRSFLNANITLSNFLDSALPTRLREDGNKYFLSVILPMAIQKDIVIYDFGGGSQPCIDRQTKEQHNITLTGLDISAEELNGAPVGNYDHIIVADLCVFEGSEDADLVVGQALLEHVPDTPGTIKAIASTLKPGGRAFIFAPSRNAVFARLNLLLPESVKQKILFSLFPSKAEGHDGFEAYYDHCTPSQIEMLADKNGLEIEKRHLFWISSYFKIFTPAFLIWRLWQGLSYLALGKDGAETFAFVLRKKL